MPRPSLGRALTAAQAVEFHPLPRKMELIGVGAAKTGTHSVAAIFGRYRADHEREAARLIDLICESGMLGELSPRTADYLRWRDRRLRLEVDSSQLNGPVAGLLAELRPKARFVLTVRHPRSWIESLINDSLRREITPKWHRWRELRFGGMPYRSEDAPLESHGLYPLAGYLRYWSWHNRTVREAVPADRLLVVPTEKLSESLDELAEFVGVDPATLNHRQSRQFVGDEDFGVLSDLGEEYVAKSIDEWCGEELAAHSAYGLR